jgi:hypothetical protein
MELPWIDTRRFLSKVFQWCGVAVYRENLPVEARINERWIRRTFPKTDQSSSLATAKLAAANTHTHIG